MTWLYLLDIMEALGWVGAVASSTYWLGIRHMRVALQREITALEDRAADAEAVADDLAKVLEGIAEPLAGARPPREVAREALGRPWSDWPR